MKFVSLTSNQQNALVFMNRNEYIRIKLNIYYNNFIFSHSVSFD